MYFFKTFVLTFMLIVLTSQLSMAIPMDEPNSDLRKTVFRLLKNPQIKKSLDESVRISFFVTADEKLVVLKTDTQTKSLDKFIKIRLNYHKIIVKDLEANRIFHVKVHFVLN